MGTKETKETKETPQVVWYAGIDWADRHHDVVLIDAEGNRVAHLRVAHSPEGLRTLIAWLRGHGEVAEHPEHLACLVETTRGLLITALVEGGLVIYPVDPGRLKALRKPGGAKTDALDAYALARLGRSELRTLRRLVPDSDLVRELKLLTRDQDGLIQQQTRLVNQLTACLKEAYPAALGLFSQLHQRSTLAFLAAFPTHEQAAVASAEAIAAVLLRAKHPTARTTAARIVTQLQAPQLRADAATVRAKARLTQTLVAQLQLLLEQMAEYDAAIARLFDAHADHARFASLPRAGQRLAPRLLAEWGEDRGRYTGAASVQALAGTCPVLFQSGQYTRARHRRACCKPLRQALHHFARESLQGDEAARAYYVRKRTEGKTHTAAVRAVANRWVRILYAMWSHQEDYDPARFAAAQHAHGPRTTAIA
jgi:transposase